MLFKNPYITMVINFIPDSVTDLFIKETCFTFSPLSPSENSLNNFKNLYFSKCFQAWRQFTMQYLNIAMTLAYLEGLY